MSPGFEFFHSRFAPGFIPDSRSNSIALHPSVEIKKRWIIGGTSKLRVAGSIPAGRTKPHFEVLDLDSDPARERRWEMLPFKSGVLAVHAALLPQGKVLFLLAREAAPYDLPAPTSAMKPRASLRAWFGTRRYHLLAPILRNQSASVLLPPAQDQKVLIMGGGPVGKADKTDATGMGASWI